MLNGLLEIDLVPSVRDWEKRFKRWNKDQAPFAIALSLTRMAKEIQDELREDLPHTFTVRSSYVQRSIRFAKATKRTPVARVGSRLEFMALQATGGRRTSPSGNVAVPIGVRRKPTDKTTPSKFPGALLKKPKHFLARMSSGRMGVWRRRRRTRFPIVLLYALVPSARVDARWQLGETASDLVRRRWPDVAHEAFAFAIRTARRKRGRR